jgi:serine/threonine-protein kinase
MALVSSGALYDALRQHHLLSHQRLAQLPGLIQGRCTEARTLARTLIQRGWLTLYQANELLAGNGAGLVVGPYHVLQWLGTGGLSQVYKARHRDYDLTVALKVLRPEVIGDEQGRAQFMQEMEAMARFDHPNIVQFCDVDQAGDTFYFAMEFVEGVDLGKQVALSGPLPVACACEYVRQAALGLQHAHERNIVHRDVKPVNLFLTHAPVLDAGRSKPRKTIPTRPVIKIIDWGLALERGPQASASAPAARNGLVGTADYLAPEQARDPAGADVRSDIYSLGCTFYFLLTGQPPFPHGNLAEKLMQHQSVRPRRLEDFRQDVPEEVDTVLRRMLAKWPQARFQTPAALASALKPFTRNEAATGQVPVRQGEKVGRGKDDTPLPGALAGPADAAADLEPRRRQTR